MIKTFILIAALAVPSNGCDSKPANDCDHTVLVDIPDQYKCTSFTHVDRGAYCDTMEFVPRHQGYACPKH